MNDNTPIETERKFIIEMPDEDFLARAKHRKITQTYLIAEHEGENLRVRCSESDGRVVYTRTAKRRLSAMSCYEEECEIDEETYATCLTHARPDSAPVEKVRYMVPYEGHLLEIDVYPFWEAYAILEVELCGEEEHFLLPPEIRVVREVTEDGRYKNTNIARHLHAHPDIPLPVAEA